jgi:hypothetical protein
VAIRATTGRLSFNTTGRALMLLNVRGANCVSPIAFSSRIQIGKYSRIAAPSNELLQVTP